MKCDRPAFSRLLAVKDLPARGRDVVIEATEKEREAIARELAMPGVDSLVASYHVIPTTTGARVTGEVVAHIRQICVVSLETFPTQLREAVDMVFATPTGRVADPLPRGELVISPDEEDPAEVLIEGKIDLGAVTFEFLALGLDPYPRKEGVEFSFKNAAQDAPSPFSVLDERTAKGSSGD
jgi:hypothetical protein